MLSLTKVIACIGQCTLSMGLHGTKIYIYWLSLIYIDNNRMHDRKKEQTAALVVKAVLNGFTAIDTGDSFRVSASTERCRCLQNFSRPTETLSVSKSSWQAGVVHPLNHLQRRSRRHSPFTASKGSQRQTGGSVSPNKVRLRRDRYFV